MKVFTDESRSYLYMVMEWVEGCELRKFMTHTGKLLPERAVGLPSISAGRWDIFILTESSIAT
jgi:hypothetical protein